jgi:hypothetical protein
MKALRPAELLPQVVIERRYTRDWPAPLHEQDLDMTEGWHSPDPNWKIYDRSKDRRTGWIRVRFVRGAS